MSSQPKRWHLAPKAPINYVNALNDIGPVMAQVLYNRGITDVDNARLFLSDNLPIHDPFKMKGMNKAVARIRTAIRREEHIVVYGDFDADGVTSTTLLVQTLQALGAKVSAYIPHRVDEGYGLNAPALYSLAEDGVSLIITVDCGIRSVEEVIEGQKAGLDIIVTDHHSIGDVIPPAYAVLNPKQTDCDYPEDMLAGVGVSFKLASALLRVASAQDKIAPSITEEDLLDLVAIGTVADLAPMDRFENRKLVKLGLEQLSKARRPGIYTLLDEAGVQPSDIRAMSIGFVIGPRINAAGRLEHADLAYQLLSTDDWGQATQLARELQELNRKRQDLTRDAFEIAEEMARQEGEDPALIFAASPQFLPGIVGLVAGRLVEQFYRPAIVVEMGEEESHGSCRSTPEFNITDALDECADILLRHGGHAQAAGFSVRNENIPMLKERMTKIAEIKLAHQELLPTITVDAEVRLDELTMDLASQLELLEPTGEDNRPPVFMTPRLRVLDARQVGREGAHLKLRLANHMKDMDAIGFNLGHWLNDLTNYVDVAYHLDINEWRGRTTLQMRLVDLKPTV